MRRPFLDARMQVPEIFNLAPEAKEEAPASAESDDVAPAPWDDTKQLLQLKRDDPYLQSLMEKCPQLSPVWRRADFWVNETATFLEVVNVLGRFETCDQWITRTKFLDVENTRTEDESNSLTRKRHEMAKRLGCAERVALYQNAPNLPFTNEKLAASVGLTVEDFQKLPVSKAACNILYDALAESRSGLIPYATVDARRNQIVEADGSFNELAFRIGHTKSTILIIVGWFIFGKANFIWVLVGVKWLHDLRPDIVPSPVDMGLFKIWGII